MKSAILVSSPAGRAGTSTVLTLPCASATVAFQVGGVITATLPAPISFLQKSVRPNQKLKIRFVFRELGRLRLLGREDRRARRGIARNCQNAHSTQDALRASPDGHDGIRA